jgi:phosphatidylglycerol:prolipoprotein diacylglycerol transferase
MFPYFYFTLPSYMVLAFIGGFFALVYTYFRIDKFNVLFTDLIKIFIVAVVGGYAGGMALYIVTQLPPLIMNFSAATLIYLVTHSGIVFYGGLFGVLLAIKLYVRRSSYKEAVIYRLIAPAIPLFHGFGRIGCFLAGCCYGKELGTSYELFGAVHIERIPVQLIEAVFEFILFFVIRLVGKNNQNWNLLKIYLLTYAVFRFLIEFLRGDEARGIFLLSTSQWVSMAIVTFYAVKTLQNRTLLTNFQADRPRRV